MQFHDVRLDPHRSQGFRPVPEFPGTALGGQEMLLDEKVVNDKYSPRRQSKQQTQCQTPKAITPSRLVERLEYYESLPLGVS
jgi:hypothetical protein